MKIRASFLWLVCLVAAMALASCEGDVGPAGPAGPTGPTGPQGVAGQNGAENCIDCHGSSQLITAKLFQWQHSVHATGGNFSRNATSCAPCHTSQGFLERIATGAMTTAATIEDPLPQNCYTCHMIHNTYTDADWALTTTDPVNFWVGGSADHGKSNLCINCHQARVESPRLPDPATGGTITITSFRYGPHHGAQGMLFSGNGGYEVEAGGTAYTNSLHTQLIENGCVTCHMATAIGAETGGHTFNVSDENGNVNTAGCIQCHDDAGELRTLITDTQTEITDLLAELRTLLIDRGLLNPDTDYAITPQDFEGHEAGAYYNYKYIEEDQSLGVHNYKYAKALLTNSIEAMK